MDGGLLGDSAVSCNNNKKSIKHYWNNPFAKIGLMPHMDEIFSGDRKAQRENVGEGKCAMSYTLL